MTTTTRWTTDVVETLPLFEGGRYEIIDGDLFVTHQPHMEHQAVCDNLIGELYIWDRAYRLGRTFQAPGLIFDLDEAVAPDLIWVSYQRLKNIRGEDGKFHAAPELVIEVVSPGKANAERDRELKLALYERYAVPEYWIVDWQAETIDVFERREMQLLHSRTLHKGEVLTSAMLPNFVCPVAQIFTI